MAFRLLAILGRAVIVLVACFTIVFLIVYAIPGDPAALMLGGPTGAMTAPPELIARINAEYGFDQPVIIQYLTRLVDTFTGNWGRSFVTGQEVSQLVLEGLAATLPLALVALLLAGVGGLVVGGLAAYTGGRRINGLLELVPPISISLPGFWVGLMLIQLFSFTLPIFPASGNATPASIVLPAITLAIPATGYLAQVFAESLRKALEQPYADVARAKGLPRSAVLFAHGVRNALPATATVFGIIAANLVAASAVIEIVFSRAGLGSAFERAVVSKDLPVVLVITVLVAAMYLVVNVVVDLVYPLIDPRVAPRARAGRSVPRGATA
ncbi:ABC transporter permease [Microbacterium sp. E-13]|uniref:ABC transporter permease n=1 Tax=Microbacterium sp. E-13 TaxID=3404048 RepID=UPI003CE98A49